MSAFLFLLFAIRLSGATPIAIHSLSPSSGPVEGGTYVTITGSGFETCVICSPPIFPTVLFGNVPAASISLHNGEQLVVLTPAHLPAIVSVTVIQWDGTSSDRIEDAFTFEGDPIAAFEPILLPVYVQETAGGYGSAFVTALNAWNEAAATPAALFGLDATCMMPVCEPPDPLTSPIVLPYGRELADIPAQIPRGDPGRFIWMNRSASESVVFQLRAFDVSRSSTNFGTAVPIVREDEFRTRITLLDVPIDPRFRNTLRIYSRTQVTVPVRLDIEGHPSVVIHIEPGANMFEPGYAEFTNFPVGGGTLRLHMEAEPDPLEHPIWAFVSVTNNETQHITVISSE